METPSIPTPLYVHCSKYIDGNAINSYAAIYVHCSKHIDENTINSDASIRALLKMFEHAFWFLLLECYSVHVH